MHRAFTLPFAASLLIVLAACGEPPPSSTTPPGAPVQEPPAVTAPPADATGPEGAPAVPPVDGAAPVDAAAPPADGVAPLDGATPPVIEAAAAAPAVDYTSLKPSKTQAELLAGPHIMLTGTVLGDCGGKAFIHAVPLPSKDPPDPSEVLGPVAQVDLDREGAFSMAVPSSTALRLFAHCDADGNGKIETSAGDKIAPSSEIPGATADISGLGLTF